MSSLVLPKLPEALSVTAQSLPLVGKLIIALLFLLNVRSWPLAWHLRVFRPVFSIRARYALFKLSIMLKSRKEKLVAEEKWLDSISPVGQNPMEIVVMYKSWASIDDSDFYGHLSNSSYGKALDSARFKAAIAMFPRIFAPGGWIALAATHFHFIREISILSSYEVRLTIASWDQKWIFLVCKFVTKPKGKKAKQIRDQKSPAESESGTRAPSNILQTSLHTPSVAGDTSDSATSEHNISKFASLTNELIKKEEPDGAILNAVTISQCCFKVGRVTVPPALVIASNGFCTPPVSADATTYTHSNPPPHWRKAQSVMLKSHGGSNRKLAQLMKGGWRDVQESERWWEEALGGVVEEMRSANLEAFDALRRGMDGARNA